MNKATFILHGGQTREENAFNDAFFACFTKYVPKETVRILLCYFARSADEWEALYKRDVEKIKKQSSKKIVTTIAQNADELLMLLPTYDVLFVQGGEAENIEQYYPKLSELGEKLKGKIYIGSSMGAFMACENYVLSFPRQDETNAHAGLGLLPFNILCHWNVEKKKEYKIDLLKKKNSTNPILTIDEGKYVEIIL